MEVISAGTGEVFKRLESEQNNPYADVAFGGGYAMVSLIERELSNRGWLSPAEFADIVAVSQMTPGPLALNVATFVGRQTAGIPGALAASSRQSSSPGQP